MAEKYCTKCGEFKDVAVFSNDKSRKDGLTCKCKSCADECNRKYREANKGKLAEYGREYREANKEKCAQMARKWREANAEKHNEYQRKYREDKRDTANFWNTLKVAEAVGNSLQEDCDE